MYERKARATNGSAAKVDAPKQHSMDLPSGETINWSGNLGDWGQGELLGSKIVGQSSTRIGAQNQDLNRRIREMVDRPSIGANRLQEAGNAQLAQLTANQAQQGITGGLAQAQRMQLQRNTSRDVAGRTQSDYESAISRLTNKQKSDAGTFVNLASAKAAHSQAENSSGGGGGMTYICTELNDQGLITLKEYEKIHEIMFLNVWRNAPQILYYLQYGEDLVYRMKKDSNTDWAKIKREIFDPSFILLAQDRTEEAIDLYISEVENIFKYHFGHSPSYAPNTTWGKLVALPKIFYHYFIRG